MLGLAPDNLLARAAERLAQPGQWLALGRAAGLVWGEFPNANKPAYRVTVRLPELALDCDCPSRKRPCRHAVGLAVLYATEPEALPRAAPPAWTAGREEANTAYSPTPDLNPAAYARRLRGVRRGMAQLDIWLRDMVHNGLAALPGQSPAVWREMAARLEDAHAPRVAAELRSLAALPGGDPAWPEALLRRLGRLYLLAQGFARYESLPPEAQADLREAAGWFADPAQPGSDLARESWLVLAAAPAFGGGDGYRTWLWGPRARRFAFIEGAPDAGPGLLAGSVVPATLRFSPGGWPVRAVIHLLHESIGVLPDSPPGQISIGAARAAYGRALALNPWQSAFPLALADCTAVPDGEGWALVDEAGARLPLPAPFGHGWHLQALQAAGDGPLFGEWDGRVFTPLAVRRSALWLPLHALRGQA